MINRTTPSKSFRARLTASGPKGAWIFLHIPFDCSRVFGRKSRIPVAGTINGFKFRNSLMPQGDGTHAMMVNKTLQAGAGATAGDMVDVRLQVDLATRTVRIPKELGAALKTNAEAAAAFKALSPSHRREFAEWIGSAKQEQTRQARARRSIPMILGRRHVK